eukprot:gnl/MRDRNA2_/MRDRNA2_335761_c0_seq1.p1 gnl/MRDRNA2_/MRDRNA2_335761_c0~~gnl/MRDRNA2_/MRDRNA2_335761_c0_seq1.p1  ORF type:complete len:109 (+),score=12.91 gnl/MRDRNA2_/MRDRNA2_335761_c0_seq1:3-329(+)
MKEVMLRSNDSKYCRQQRALSSEPSWTHGAHSVAVASPRRSGECNEPRSLSSDPLIRRPPAALRPRPILPGSHDSRNRVAREILGNTGRPPVLPDMRPNLSNLPPRPP